MCAFPYFNGMVTPTNQTVHIKIVVGKNTWLRNSDWPTSLGGKAHDTAVVLAWLEDFFSRQPCASATWPMQGL